MGDMLSQDEINALLGGENPPEDNNIEENDSQDIKNSEIKLSKNEKDVLGEIGNISMGTSATTLYALLGEKVLITTPNVRIMNWDEIGEEQMRPCVGIQVDYTEGLTGSNVLVLKQRDVKIISSLMLGEGGEIDDSDELTDLELSAIGEAMNQMVGSASTSLASLMDMKIDIDTPKAFELNFDEDHFLEKLKATGEPVVCIAFKMEIGELVDSEIMQVLPLPFAKQLVEEMEAGLSEGMKPDHKVPDPMPLPSEAEEVVEVASTEEPVIPQKREIVEEREIPIEATSASISGVDARPVEFESFDTVELPHVQKENMSLIMDVPLEVTVELGRTTKKIHDILEFTPGTIVELNRLAGEPIDVLVNGKKIAKGEVVVIEENFCVRIVDIISPEDRI